MKNVLLLFILLFTTITFAQDKETQSKELYATALKAYENNEYKTAFSNLQKAIEIGGGTNKYIEVLKVNCYIAQRDWANAKYGADNLFKSLPKDEVLNTLSLTQEQISTKYESFLKAAQEKKQNEIEAKITILESKQKQAIDSIKNDIVTKNKILEVEAKAKASLSLLENLKEGYLYSIDKAKISSNPDEKSYFVFYGDKYLIFTIPTKKSLTAFTDLTTFEFKPDGSNDKDVYVYFKNRDIQSRWFRKTEHNDDTDYIEYVENNNVLIPHNYHLFKKNDFRIYYYFKNNELLAGLHYSYDVTTLFPEFDKTINDPYIETGTIRKLVNYNLIKNGSLKDKLTAHNFKASTDQTQNVVLELKPNSTISTVFISERILFKTYPKTVSLKETGEHFLMYFPKEQYGLHYFLKFYNLPQNNIPITAETLTKLNISMFDELDFKDASIAFNSKSEGLPLGKKYFKFIPHLLNNSNSLLDTSNEDNDQLLNENEVELLDKYYNSGVLAEQNGDYNSAEEFYKRALEIDPNYTNANLTMAVLILKMNKSKTKSEDNDNSDRELIESYQKAIPHFEIAMKNTPEIVKQKPEMKNAILNLMITIYIKLGETKKANKTKELLN